MLNDSPRINNEEHGSEMPKLVKGKKQDSQFELRSYRELGKEQKQEAVPSDCSLKATVTQTQHKPCSVPVITKLFSKERLHLCKSESQTGFVQGSILLN